MSSRVDRPGRLTTAEYLALIGKAIKATKPAGKTRTKPASPERDRQIDVVGWLHKVLPPGCIVAAFVNEAPTRSKDPGSRARFYDKRRKAGVRDGMTDLLVIGPVPLIVFLEMKDHGGTVSLKQQEVHAELRALGWHVGVATDRESARLVLREAGVPLNEPADLPAHPAKFYLEKPKALRVRVVTAPGPRKKGP